MSDLVIIVFTIGIKGYSAGEEARFSPHRAAEFVKQGVARYQDDVLQAELEAELEAEPVEISPERIEKIQDAIRQLDRDDPELWRADGRPKVYPLARALGASVTSDELDAAWAALRAGDE